MVVHAVLGCNSIDFEAAKLKQLDLHAAREASITCTWLSISLRSNLPREV